MTEKQMRFCEEYLIDANATRAYLAAYPNCRKNSSADAAARKLLGNTRIKAYIDERLEQLRSEKTADAREVLEYLTAVLRGETSSHVLAMCGDGCQEVVEKPPDEKERLKAAELLGKRYGLYTERVDLDPGDLQLTVKIDYGGDDNEN